MIMEKSKSRSIDVCGGWRRVRPVYQSVTNQIEIQLIGTLIRDHLPKFLLKYEGKARDILTFEINLKH